MDDIYYLQGEHFPLNIGGGVILHSQEDNDFITPYSNTCNTDKDTDATSEPLLYTASKLKKEQQLSCLIFLKV